MRRLLAVHCSGPSREGITLIEVLVTMGIVAFLVAIMLPAIAGSREAARRTDCVSRMKNIRIALTNFEQVNGRYPDWAMYGDSHVDFVSQSIDRQVWRELSSCTSLSLDGEER